MKPQVTKFIFLNDKYLIVIFFEEKCFNLTFNQISNIHLATIMWFDGRMGIYFFSSYRNLVFFIKSMWGKKAILTEFLYQVFKISTEFQHYLDKTIMLQRQLLTGSGHPQCGLGNMACKPPSETEVTFSSLLKV